MADNHNQRVRPIQRPHVSASHKRSTVDNRAAAKSAYERYVSLARAAAANGHTVESENLFQHAEHYLRLSRAPDE